MDDYRGQSHENASRRVSTALYDYDEYGYQTPSVAYPDSRPMTQYHEGYGGDNDYLGGRHISANGIPYDIISFDDENPGDYDNYPASRPETQYTYYDRPNTISAPTPMTSQQYKDHVPSYMETTHNANYNWKVPLPRQRNSGAGATRASAPFYAETTNRADFGPKEALPSKKYDPPTQSMSKVPFYGETTSRATYTPKQMLPQAKNLKPAESAVGRSKVEADWNTTNNTHYLPVQGERVKAIKRESSLFPGGQGRYSTEVSDSFTPKKDNTCPAEKYMASASDRGRFVNGHWFMRTKKPGVKPQLPVQPQQASPAFVQTGKVERMVVHPEEEVKKPAPSSASQAQTPKTAVKP